MFKKLIASFTLVGVVALALASSGGGGNKKRSSIHSDFTTISNNTRFSLKSGPQYAGSQIFSSLKNKNFTLYNTIVKYQKGNVVYILPYQYKMRTGKPCLKSNLNVVDLKINFRK